jgi:hypothetical protein
MYPRERKEDEERNPPYELMYPREQDEERYPRERKQHTYHEPHTYHESHYDDLDLYEIAANAFGGGIASVVAMLGLCLRRRFRKKFAKRRQTKLPPPPLDLENIV